MIKDTQLDPLWVKKYDPPNIEPLECVGSMTKTWEQVVDELGQWADRCITNYEEKNDVSPCDTCPAHDVCVSEPDIMTCRRIINLWAKEKCGKCLR